MRKAVIILLFLLAPVFAHGSIIIRGSGGGVPPTTNDRIVLAASDKIVLDANDKIILE